LIKGDNKKWARMIFNPYEEYLLKKNFDGFYLTGILPEINTESSLLVTPNHFSWWDGFFIDFVSRKLLKKNFYVIMLDEQLKRYNFSVSWVRFLSIQKI
jgi:1-acyl-sn-glycerol-3-phosphate acyltransferase